MIAAVRAVTRDAAVVEQFVRAFFDGGFLHARGARAQHRAQHASVRAHMTAHHDIFQRGHVGEQTDVLERASDTRRRHLMRTRIR